MTDKDKIAMLKQYRVDAEEGNRGTFRRMSRCERFRIGDQWDYEVKERNRFLRKHTITVNRIHPTVLQISGQQVQNPRDLRVVFSKSRARVRANILTALGKQVMDTNLAQHVCSFGFDNGATTGRGWLGIDINYADDPERGDLTVNQYDPFTVLPDPCCKNYDMNNPKQPARFLIIDEWEDKKKLEYEYPKKKDELANANYTWSADGGIYASIVNFIFDRSAPGSVTDDYRTTNRQKDEEYNITNQQKYNYRKSTIWWREWKKGVYLQRRDEPLEYLMYYTPSKIAAARKIAASRPDDVRIYDKDRDGHPLTVSVLHKAVMVGDTLLEDIEDPFKGVMSIPVVRYSPYYVNGYEFGLVDNLLGPQEQLNWSRSMYLNIMKTLANTGWIVGKAMGKTKKWLEVHGSEDGVILSKEDYGRSIEKIKQNEPNQGMLISSSQASEDIGQISNVRQESPQTDKDRVASAIRLKQAASFTGSATLFANWDFTYKLLGTILIEMIRRNGTFTEDEIRAVVDEEDLIDPQLMEDATQAVMKMFEQQGVNLQQPPEPPDARGLSALDPEMQQVMIDSFEDEMKEYQFRINEATEIAKKMAEEMLFDEIEQAHKGKLGLTVSLSPMAESMRVIKQLETLELHKVLVESQMPGISRERLIEAADPPNKEAILAEGVSAPAVQQAVQGNTG